MISCWNLASLNVYGRYVILSIKELMLCVCPPIFISRTFWENSWKLRLLTRGKSKEYLGFTVRGMVSAATAPRAAVHLLPLRQLRPRYTSSAS